MCHPVDEPGVASTGGQPDERRRRLLYVDLGRPRPFYRVNAEDVDDGDGGLAVGGDPPSLQVRCSGFWKYYSDRHAL